MDCNYAHDVKINPPITDNMRMDSGEGELVYNFHVTGCITVVKLSGLSGESNINGCDGQEGFTVETSPEGCEYEIRINGTVNVLNKSGTGMENDLNESEISTNLNCTSSDSFKKPIDRDALNNLLVPPTSSFTSTMITASAEAIDCLNEGLSEYEEMANSPSLHSRFIPLSEIKEEIGSEFDGTFTSNHTETLINTINGIVKMSTANCHMKSSPTFQPFVDSDLLYSIDNRCCSSEPSTVGQNRPEQTPDSVQAKGQSSSLSEVNSSIPSQFTRKQLLTCTLCGFTCSWKGALQSHLEAHLSDTFDGSVKRTKVHRFILKRPGKTFTCCLCQEIFELPQQLFRHLQASHCQDKIFSCSVCDYFCEEMGTLTEHVQNEHMNMNKYFCYSCNSKFDTLDLLFHHISVTHAEKKLLSCILCSFVCSTANSMIEHTLTLHAQRDASLKPFFCAFCEYATNRFDDLCNHQRYQHTDERPFLCSQCGSSFKRKDALKYHEQSVHSEERSYQCSKCDQAYKTTLALSGHMKTHIDSRPYACEHCQIKFKTRSTLKGHIINKHSTARPFKCSCSASFKIACDLRLHVKWKHSVVTLVSCSLCPYTTKDIRLLKNHNIRMHTKEKPYSCPQCDYTCKLQVDLNQHIKKKHSNKKRKRFQCEHCDFSTRSKCYMNRHFVNMHSEERPFTCSMCDATFKGNRNLKNHMYTHSDEKPYSCDVCDHSSKTKNALKCHMLDKHSKEKPFVCTQCKYACKRKGSLKRHVRLRHKRSK